MIAKPNDWETAPAYTGEGRSLTPGGHIARILGMKQEAARNTGKPMLVVSFDIEEGSEYDGFFKQAHTEKKKFDQNAKWQGVIRYMLYAKDGMSTNSFFKGFISSVEESNPGWNWNWDERSVTGKLVGLVFGEEEYRKTDGGIGVSVKAQQARSVKAIRDGVSVPERKKLKKEPQGYAPFDPNADFTQAEEPLPWEM